MSNSREKILCLLGLFLVIKMCCCFVGTNPCAPNPCANGGSCTNCDVEYCDDPEASYSCFCATGFYGPTCDSGMSRLTMSKYENIRMTWFLFICCNVVTSIASYSSSCAPELVVVFSSIFLVSWYPNVRMLGRSPISP